MTIRLTSKRTPHPFHIIGKRILSHAHLLGKRIAERTGFRPHEKEDTGPEISNNDLIKMLNQSWDYRRHDKQPQSFRDWTLQPSVSTKLMLVYTRNDTLVMAFRGTDMQFVPDLEADALIVAGRYDNSRRDQEVENQVKNVFNHFPDMRYYLFTGHSLGGREAWNAFARRWNDKRTYYRSFNPAPLGLKFHSFPASHRIRVLRTKSDIVSATNQLGVNVESIERTSDKDPHATDHFKE